METLDLAEVSDRSENGNPERRQPEELNFLDAEKIGPAPGRPNTCARCLHWGAVPDYRETPRWRLCLVQPAGLAHLDYWCPNYARRAPCHR
jgi:hypothetical protein